MNKVVFFDRDGVINQENGSYNYLPEQFILNPNILTAISLLKQNGYLVIVVSNQGGIDKGIYSVSEVMKLNEIFVKELTNAGTEIDEFYFCPHHSDISNCLCRKPKSLMLEKAIARFNINPDLSYLIGDSNRDIEAAKQVGVKGILIPPNTDIIEVCNQIIMSNE